MVTNYKKPNSNNKSVIYEKPRLTENDGSAIFRIVSIPGKRDYPNSYKEAGVDYNIKDNDKRILIEIETAKECPHCGKGGFILNNFVFTEPDQEMLWKAVFDAWVLPSKKYRYGIKFLKFIKKHLLQTKLPY